MSASKAEFAPEFQRKQSVFSNGIAMQSCVTCIGAQSEVDVELVSHVTEKQNDLVVSFLIPSATGFFLSAFFYYYKKKYHPTFLA